jgi:hypothetical protein
MKTRDYIVSIGNASPLNYECYRINARNFEQAAFRAGQKCARNDWNLLSIEVAKNQIGPSSDKQRKHPIPKKILKEWDL